MKPTKKTMRPTKKNMHMFRRVRRGARVQEGDWCRWRLINGGSWFKVGRLVRWLEWYAGRRDVTECGFWEVVRQKRGEA